MTLGACQQQCGRDEPGCNELANKHEYSVLQAIAFDLRNKAHDRSYILYRNALDSDLTVIAFPKAQATKGYVALLANAEVPPRDKSVPDEDFIVTAATLAAVRAKVDLSPELDRYLEKMAARSAEGLSR